MQQHGLQLAKHSGRRPGHTRDGKVRVMRSNLRWCSDRFEFTCWNGEIVRVAFVIDAHDREIIAWRGVAGGGISGSEVRDMMLECVEKRFATIRARSRSSGCPTTARPTRPRTHGTSRARSISCPASRRSPAPSRTVWRTRSCVHSSATICVSTRCRMRSPSFSRSLAGSRTTTAHHNTHLSMSLKGRGFAGRYAIPRGVLGSAVPAR